MLPAAARMRRRGEFSATVRGGRRAGGPTLVVHLRRSPGATPHVGFVVPRAVGGAVVRNAVRRRLRHLCRARLAGLPTDAQLVVRALPPAAAADSSALGRDLDRALQRLLDPAVGRS